MSEAEAERAETPMVSRLVELLEIRIPYLTTGQL